MTWKLNRILKSPSQCYGEKAFSMQSWVDLMCLRERKILDSYFTPRGTLIPDGLWSSFPWKENGNASQRQPEGASVERPKFLTGDKWHQPWCKTWANFKHHQRARGKEEGSEATWPVHASYGDCASARAKSYKLVLKSRYKTLMTSSDELPGNQ